jgi:hypothetical protein
MQLLLFFFYAQKKPPGIWRGKLCAKTGHYQVRMLPGGKAHRLQFSPRKTNSHGHKRNVEQEGSVMTEQQFSERLDQETVERICRAIQDADWQLRKAKRALRSRVRAAVAEHSERVIEAAAPRKPAGARVKADYAKLYAILQKQPLTYDIIKHETGLNDSGVAQVITTLSLDYPVWNPAKGIYEILR